MVYLRRREGPSGRCAALRRVNGRSKQASSKPASRHIKMKPARKKGNPTHPHPPSHPDPISPPSAGNNHYPKRSRRTHYELDLPTGEGTAALQREHPAPYRRVVIGRSNQCWDIRSIRSTVACSLPYRRYKTGSKTRPKGKRKKEEDEEEEEGEKTKKNHYNKNKNGPL